MHYTGMLAYQLTVPVYLPYSNCNSVSGGRDRASFVALFVVSRPHVGFLHVIVGSSLMATGIAGMHYTGMAAMRLPAMHHWDTTFVALSVVIAVVVSLAALGLTFLFREDKPEKSAKIICSIIMGFAIPAMHYTGDGCGQLHAYGGGAGPDKRCWISPRSEMRRSLSSRLSSSDRFFCFSAGLLRTAAVSV